MNTNIVVKTKADARATAATETNLTIDWDGMSQEDLIALAQQTLVIKLQGGWRKNGIPTELTVKAVDHKVGVRAPRAPTDIFALVNKLSPEERAAFLAKLTAE